MDLEAGVHVTVSRKINAQSAGTNNESNTRQPETELVTLQPTWRHYLGTFIGAIGAVAAGIIVDSVISNMAKSSEEMQNFPHVLFNVMPGLFLLVGVVSCLWAVLDRKFRRYEITTRRVMLRYGIIARKMSTIDVADIRNVTVNQGIVERLLGIGTVGIASAATGTEEIKFKGIDELNVVRQKIVEVKEAVQNQNYTNE
jgi:uncharacterized membrane protein YdbT with pleckstrin-like domain